MDITISPEVRDGLGEAAPCGPAGPSLAGATVSWISARPGYWPDADGQAPPLGAGVVCLVFGIGGGCSAWVARLAQSQWFAGLEPRPNDLAAAVGQPAGGWRLPDAGAADQHDAAFAFFRHGAIPDAPLAMVAITRDAGRGELAAATGLVAALRARRCGRGCRTAVVVTFEGGPAPAALAAVHALRSLGALVIRPGMAMGGDHLHHFPLRAIMEPRKGRLICVDLADHFACWPPGGVADLHAIPSACDAAEPVVRGLAETGCRRACAITLHMQLDAGVSGGSVLERIDRLATLCQAVLLEPDGPMVFTDIQWLDGATTTADLLIVRNDDDQV